MSIFKKKTWENRQSEFPTRRRLIETEIQGVYDVEREEGLVLKEGDAFSEKNMNDLEVRIDEAVAAVEEKILCTEIQSAGASDVVTLVCDSTGASKMEYDFSFANKTSASTVYIRLIKRDTSFDTTIKAGGIGNINIKMVRLSPGRWGCMATGNSSAGGWSNSNFNISVDEINYIVLHTGGEGTVFENYRGVLQKYYI